MKKKSSKKYIIFIVIFIILVGILPENISLIISLGIVSIILSPIIIRFFGKKDNEEKENVQQAKIVLKSEEELEEYMKNPSVFAKKTNENFEDDKNIYIENTYKRPNLSLLKLGTEKNIDTNEISNTAKNIEATFNSFNIKSNVVEVHIGPNQTQYELNIERGVKLDKISNLRKELCFATGDENLTLELPIPGKNTIGITITNKTSNKVILRNLIKNIKEKNDLILPLGYDINGEEYLKLSEEKSFMVTGTVGSGKSIFLHNIILSILYSKKPEEVKLVLIDPKKSEFNYYREIPHLLTPIVTTPKSSLALLNKVVDDINNRCEKLKQDKSKNIESYNNKIEENSQVGMQKMPYILIIIDELSELLFFDKKHILELISKITSMSRTTGIYIIAAFNQPYLIDKDLLDALPVIASFNMSESPFTAKIGLSTEYKNLCKGEMIFKSQKENVTKRIQVPYVSDEEIRNITNDIKGKNGKPKLEKVKENNVRKFTCKDGLYDEVLNYAMRMGEINASLIQRKFNLGYNRAYRIMEQFEENGVVGPGKGSKPRKVLIMQEKQ